MRSTRYLLLVLCTVSSALPACGDEFLASFDAALMHRNQKAYFFKGNDYFRFDFSIDRFDKIGRTGRSGWAGVWTDGIDAALEHPNGKVYFFRKNKYQRFDFDKNEVDKEATIDVDGWKGLWTNGMDAALLHPNGKAYFFKGAKYRRFDFEKDEVEKEGTINQSGWRGVWPDGIDSALVHPNGRAYFFKGAKYRRFDFEKDEVDREATINRGGWKFLEDYAVIPDIGKTSRVCLQSWMGTFVSARKGDILVANSPEAHEAETFELKRLDEDHVTLRAHTDRFVCAQQGGGTILLANRNKAEDWETFSISTDTNGLIYLSTHKGQLVCVDDSGMLIADRDKATEHEAFHIVHPAVANGDQTRIEVNVYKIQTAPFWHTGTVIDGREYYFQTSNRVESCDPEGMSLKHHRTMVRLVPGNVKAVAAVRDIVISRWDGTRYDVADHNCNVFTDDLIRTLGASGLDREYLDASGLAKGLRQLPGGAGVQELIVKWPIKDKRMDEAFMEDLARLGRLPDDIRKEAERFGGNVSQAAKDAGGSVSKAAKRIFDF